MSNYLIRPGHTVPAGADETALTDREFLEKTLKAVKRRRGLIHGTLTDHGRVCALGALVESCGGDVVLNGRLPFELQMVNDWMPKATPRQRRLKVVRWLETQLEALRK